MAKFQPGTSGNPAGRPPGIVSQRKLREAIQKDVPEILQAMVKAAKAGDVQAARLLLDRTLPPIKGIDAAVDIPLSGSDLSSDGRSILGAISSGDITPEQGKTLMTGLTSLARIVEINELVERVEALEKAHSAPHQQSS